MTERDARAHHSSRACCGRARLPRPRASRARPRPAEPPPSSADARESGVRAPQNHLAAPRAPTAPGTCPYTLRAARPRPRATGPPRRPSHFCRKRLMRYIVGPLYVCIRRAAGRCTAAFARGCRACAGEGRCGLGASAGLGSCGGCARTCRQMRARGLRLQNARATLLYHYNKHKYNPSTTQVFYYSIPRRTDQRGPASSSTRRLPLRGRLNCVSYID